jgi:POT family proton-dependent oligopeptide transporter
VEKRKVFAIVLVSQFSVVFWVLWYLTYLAAYDYGGQFINMNMSGFTVPLSWFDSLNSFVCIALGPVLAALWFRMSKSTKGDMSLFKKLGLGLGFLGMSFLMLVFAELSRGGVATAKASIIWLILFSILLSMRQTKFTLL